MAVTFTTTDLLARIRAMCQLRTDNQKVSTAEILSLCDEEIQTNLFPALMTIRDDYQVANTIQILTAGITRYRVPFEASSSTIDRITVLELSGTTPVSEHPLNRLLASDMSRFTSTTTGQPVAYAIIGDNIVIGPTPDATAASTYALSIYSEYRPSRLAEVSACRAITSGSSTPPYVSLVLGSTIVGTGLVAGSRVDVVPASPPLMPFISGAEIVSIGGDPTITINPSYAVSAAQLVSQLTLAGSLGSYLVPRGSTCVFPMPEAWWPVLVYASAAAVCASIGDDGAAVKFATIAEQKKAAVLGMQQNRVRKQPLPAFNKNSPLRSGRGLVRGSNTFP